MKSFIISSLLLLSFQTLASSLQSSFEAATMDNRTKITGIQKKNILEALRIEVQKTKTSCKAAFARGIVDEVTLKKNLLASLTSQTLESDVVIVRNDQSMIQVTFKYRDGDREIMTFTTSDDLKTLTALNVMSFKIVKEEVNVGTIINPIIETQDVIKNQVEINCSLK